MRKTGAFVVKSCAVSAVKLVIFSAAVILFHAVYFRAACCCGVCFRHIYRRQELFRTRSRALRLLLSTLL